MSARSELVSSASTTAVVAAIALGSNLGVREEHLGFALRELARIPATRVLARSTWIETDAVGGPPGQGRYLNGAVLVETRLSARALLEALLAIEVRAGRRRVAGQRHLPRTLDLDLLVYGAERIDEPDLRVPHPALAEREFVLQPLNEIAPELEIPGTRRSVAECLRALRSRVPASGAAAS